MTIVAPFAAGGSTDLIARLFAQQLSARLGQQFVVDNKAGGNGAVGSGAVARARPDGYTLLITPNSTYAINPHLYTNLPYNQERDFAPIGLLALNGFFVCVPGQLAVPHAGGPRGRGQGGAGHDQLRLGRHRLGQPPRPGDVRRRRRH